jgi:beta-N-acetylhexosaminidase
LNLVKLSLEAGIGQRLMLAFHGKDHSPDEFRRALQDYRPGGITLFRSLNIDNPAQVRSLSDEVQSAARQAGLPQLLIAADQEGGQLMAIGEGTTQLPGNMALGAVRDAGLARRAGEVLGRELAAMGINVNYAPCCDVNINPANPVIGIRSFGEDPRQVADLAAALTEGIQSVGVAATAKHFPGHGDVSGDSHHGLPTVPHSLERLREVEFPPFESAIRAGTKLVMTAHVALPAIDGPAAPPATLSLAVLKGILREQLHFSGVIITDAMDMQAIAQGEALGDSAVRAAAAGADLLLITSKPADQRVVHSSLVQAAANGSLAADALDRSVERISSLKRWLADGPAAPDASVVGCAAHRQIADEIARRSVTLVRDRAGLLPLRLAARDRVAVVVPRPSDLTPADTSSYVVPALTAALREFHPEVDELGVPHSPSDQDIAAVVERMPHYNLIVVGTLNAFNDPGQRALVRETLKTGIPVIVVAMRLPYDLTAFEEAPTFICTYSILEPSMRALAAALFGKRRFEGRLPVSVPKLYPAGAGQTL